MSRTLGEIIQIHVGQAGVQIANACWELYCIEHGINVEGCLKSLPQDDSYKPFFSITNTRKLVPRVIMVDTEPTVIDEIRSGCYRHLFDPNTLITGKEDTGSNYACGYYNIGADLIDCTMDNIRKIAESCENLRGFLMFRAVGGGTGAGLGNLILNSIHSQYGKIPKMEYIIFPSPTLSPLIVEPYNAILSTHSRLDISECSFIIDNEALYNICSKKLEVKFPTYTNLNRIIGQVISAFTAPLRFSNNSSNFAFADCHTNLVPYPRIHFPLVSYAPLISPVKASYGALGTEQLTYECFDPSNQLVRCNPAEGKNMACILLYRGDVSSGDINKALSNMKMNKTTNFVDWSPTGFKFAINSMPASFVLGGDLAATNRTLLTLTNNTAIQKAWCRLLAKYNLLMSRRAFIHHFVGEGLEENTLREASENVCALIREYQKAEGSDEGSKIKK